MASSNLLLSVSSSVLLIANAVAQDSAGLFSDPTIPERDLPPGRSFQFILWLENGVSEGAAQLSLSEHTSSS